MDLLFREHVVIVEMISATRKWLSAIITLPTFPKNNHNPVNTGRPTKPVITDACFVNELTIGIDSVTKEIIEIYMKNKQNIFAITTPLKRRCFCSYNLYLLSTNSRFLGGKVLNRLT
jgi:hypothetical protein